MAEPASGKGKPSDKVCEAADAPAPSFKSDMRKHFGYSPSQVAFQVSGVFPVTRKVADRQRSHCGTTTYTHTYCTFPRTHCNAQSLFNV